MAVLLDADLACVLMLAAASICPHALAWACVVHAALNGTPGHSCLIPTARKLSRGGHRRRKIVIDLIACTAARTVPDGVATFPAGFSGAGRPRRAPSR